jgi:hypothetical protein
MDKEKYCPVEEIYSRNIFGRINTCFVYFKRWRFELQQTSKCIIGEAYGYSSEYTENCDKCDRIGCKFLYYFTFNWRKRLELNKQEFVKHWNKEHNQFEHPFH